MVCTYTQTHFMINTSEWSPFSTHRWVKHLLAVGGLRENLAEYIRGLCEGDGCSYVPTAEEDLLGGAGLSLLSLGGVELSRLSVGGVGLIRFSRGGALLGRADECPWANSLPDIVLGFFWWVTVLFLQGNVFHISVSALTLSTINLLAINLALSHFFPCILHFIKTSYVHRQVQKYAHFSAIQNEPVFILKALLGAAINDTGHEVLYCITSLVSEKELSKPHRGLVMPFLC